MKNFFSFFLAHSKGNIILAFTASFIIAVGFIITPCVDAYNPRGCLVVTPPDSTGVFNVLGYKVPYARLLDCPPPILWCFLDYSGEEWSYSLLDKEQFLGKFMLHAKKISLSRPELKDKFNVFEQYKPGSNRHPAFYVLQELKDRMNAGHATLSQTLHDALLFQNESIFLNHKGYLAYVTDLAIKVDEGIKSPELLEAIQKMLPASCSKRVVLALSYNVSDKFDLETKIYHNLNALSCNAGKDLLDLNEILPLSIKHYKSLLDKSVDDADFFKEKLFKMVNNTVTKERTSFKQDFNKEIWTHREIAEIKELMERNDIRIAGDRLHNFFVSSMGKDRDTNKLGFDISWRFIEKSLEYGHVRHALTAISDVYSRPEFNDKNTKKLQRVIKKEIGRGQLHVTVELLKVSKKVAGDRCNLCSFSITVADIMISKGLKEEGCDSKLVKKGEELLNTMKCKDDEAIAKYIDWSRLFGENLCAKKEIKYKKIVEKGGMI